jgi:hypothetical protein
LIFKYLKGGGHEEGWHPSLFYIKGYLPIILFFLNRWLVVCISRFWPLKRLL